MDLNPPAGPARVADLDSFENADTGYPIQVNEDGEILAFVALGDVEGALYAYDPFGGWRCVNSESLEEDATPEKSWIQAKSDGITNPVPAGMRVAVDFEESHRLKEELLEVAGEEQPAT